MRENIEVCVDKEGFDIHKVDARPVPDRSADPATTIYSCGKCDQRFDQY